MSQPKASTGHCPVQLQGRQRPGQSLTRYAGAVPCTPEPCGFAASSDSPGHRDRGRASLLLRPGAHLLRSWSLAPVASTCLSLCRASAQGQCSQQLLPAG